MKTGNQNDLAKLRDVSRQLVNKYVAQGKIPKLKDELIDLAEGLRILTEIKTKGKGNGNGDGGKPGLRDEQARLAGHKADIAEMESRKMAGELVEVALVLAEFSKFVSAVRQRFLGLGTKLVPVVFAQKSPAGIKKVTDGAIHEALNQFEYYNAESGKCEIPSTRQAKPIKGKNPKKLKQDI